ncbi:MAG: GNAT family N-acetyltransferase [Planctomycetota bacterium]|jgi:GNAT superfamily N-acetyltransferase
MTVIYMERDNLSDISEYQLPEEYHFTWYREGDEAAWLDIHAEADKYNNCDLDLYRKSFGDDAEELSRRQCFINDSKGFKIATASAWFENNYKDERWGRVHWVAVRPAYQGRGLAKPLLSEILLRLTALHEKKVYLTTQSVRIPAINMYLKYGFRPVINNNEEIAKWVEVKIKLPDYSWIEWGI